jgi:hypothetical protein
MFPGRDVDATEGEVIRFTEERERSAARSAAAARVSG